MESSDPLWFQTQILITLIFWKTWHFKIFITFAFPMNFVLLHFAVYLITGDGCLLDFNFKTFLWTLSVYKYFVYQMVLDAV
jgi:hypothetical protein